MRVAILDDVHLFQYVERAEEAWNVISKFYKLHETQAIPARKAGP